MNAREILHLAHRRGAGVALDGDGLKLVAPKDFPDYIRAEMRLHKAEVMELLREIGEREAECQNPFTPHRMHTLDDHCNPNVCGCYRMYGKPYLCAGAPCFWVFPSESYRPKEKAR